MDNGPVIRRIELPADIADLIRQKVAKREYASEAEVIRAAFRLLEQQDRAGQKPAIHSAKRGKANAFSFGRMFGY